jgi:acyl-CoA thioesterase
MKPNEIVHKMFDNDAFSKWLGIVVEEISEGKCVLSMTIRKEMTNGFGIAHGGITYSLADSALAFAANSTVLARTLPFTSPLIVALGT